MHKIGLSFQSPLSADEVRAKYIRPLSATISEAGAGIYANYLRQVDPDDIQPTEHLLIFEAHDFKQALRLLRVQIEKIGLPEGVQFQNLNPSSPGY
ncbi:MAG: hypothetical protein CMJ72_10185 [Planctomycetaceae bacterium]|nr:hypothetical protein [Planctomycetaceae bacterium]MCH2594720.1 hypothetical protein [Pirellulales bacterium]HCK41578.1 hypothetical protein [Planctomycetaceae bacterium]|tara:strand:+ start:537 stop:824 length:288 start_codon:yes stop_codon:yes gene_type:complete